MTIQATLIVSGEVQSVGYREYVYRQAIRLGLIGLVRNIDEKKVWIICEGDPDKIEEFIRDIKVNDALARVDNISTSYSEARGCFDTFLVTRDLRFNGLPEAKMEQGVEYLKLLVAGVTDIKDCINHMDSHISSDIRTMDSNMGQRFDHLDQKHDATIVAMKTMDSNMGQSFSHLDNKYGEFGNSLKGIGDSMKGMAFDIHAIRLASFPPRRKIGKQVLKQARS
jgi:acylphosphatase